MITEKEILYNLDHTKDSIYSTFIWLGDVYSFLIDSRLNIFRDTDKRWAIATERLGYNPRYGEIVLEISYYGNCLINLEEYNNQKPNYYIVNIVDREVFWNASNGESIKDDTGFILVRGKQVKLSNKKSDYESAGIKLKEYEPNEIRWEEAGRLMNKQHPELFRARDVELYKSIPKDLQKIMVIDEWYHRDFELDINAKISEDILQQSYETLKNLPELGGIDFFTFSELNRQQELKAGDWNLKQSNENRPSAYETWQLIAKVISTGDIEDYKPTIKPNSHWSNWPDSGSL